MNILYLIPARGGSKGLPGKNIKLLNGEPMIYYTIDAARTIEKDSNICVSTDDPLIAEMVESYGLKVPFIRPAELATDDSTSEQVIFHALEFYELLGRKFDFVVLLQPTSPLRSGKNIKDALALINKDTEIIVSVKETDANPYYVLYEEDSEGHLIKSKEGSFTKRQDCPKVFELNGAIYIINVEKVKSKKISHLQKKKFVMHKLNSLDIDDIIDFKIADCLLCDNNFINSFMN